MKDLVLIAVLLAAFAFGYYLVTKVDRFVEENQRLIAAEKQKGQSRIRIAAESPILLEAVSGALERCLDAEPHLSFALCSARAGQIIDKLMEEKIDIVLLYAEPTEPLDGCCACVYIPYEKNGTSITVHGMSVENLDDETRIHVVWKKSVRSKNRDRVLFALENEP